MTQQAFQLINPAGLYEPAPNAYSHVARLEGVRLVYLAGQGGEDVEGKLSSDFGAQVRQALANLHTALAAAGAGISDVVKLTSQFVNSVEGGSHQLRADLRSTTVFSSCREAHPERLWERF